MKTKPDFCHNAPCIPTAAGLPLNVMVYWCGHQRTTQRSYRWNGMCRGSHPLVLWQYTISGCGAVDIDGKTLPVRPGEAFLLVIPEKHLFYRTFSGITTCIFLWADYITSRKGGSPLFLH